MKTLLTSLTPLLMALTACNTGIPPDASAPDAGPKDSAALIKRGEHLVTIAGCHDCHSPKRMGAQGPEIIPETMLSGAPANGPVFSFDTAMARRGIAQMSGDMTAAAGPWGVSFASNLTGDETGAGSWPLENFKRALREGKSKGVATGRMLLPPMPWQNYKHMTDEEIQAIHAYLGSITPVRNIAPEPIVFP